jgi:drug/metabolite transporter (DMT)-like permease
LDEQNGQARTWLLTMVAMTAFAANSLLCRMALGAHEVDAASFTAVRLASGAVTLAVLALFLRDGNILAAGSWLSGLQLFLYAVAFSFAYLSLGAGTGSLILFGSVQATMIISGLRNGERPNVLQWAGLAIALAGLIYLVFPGITAPSHGGSLLMALAGIAWGLYSLRGRGAKDPVCQTTGNFIKAVPFSLVVWAGGAQAAHAEPTGILLALLSGSLASGIGYVVWYAALRGLSSTRAASVQLSVPVLAAFGGVIFLAEVVTLRLVIASILILGGVALTVIAKELKAERGQGDPPEPLSNAGSCGIRRVL